MDFSAQYDLNLNTTYKNDYKYPRQTGRVLAKWPKSDNEKVLPSPKPAIQVNNETLEIGLPDTNVPFDLFHELEPINHSIPQLPFRVEKLLVDDESQLKKRPRIVQSPAVSLDDAAVLLGGDPHTKDLLRQFTYTSTWAHASTEAALPIRQKTNIPNSTWERQCDPVRVQTSRYPVLPPGWSKLAGDWDKVQMRHLVDPTGSFWKFVGPTVKCPCSYPYAKLFTPELVRELTTLVERDQLHLSYDVPLPFYTGYLPKNTTGIPLAKREQNVNDAWMPVSAAFAMRTVSKNGCKKF